MKVILILIFTLFAESSFFAQIDSDHHSYSFGITQIDSINYHRKFCDVDGKISIDTSSVTLHKNSLVRILGVADKGHKYMVESYSMFYTDGTDENDPVTCIHRDTLFIDDENLFLIDSVNIPDSYLHSILKPFYGNSSDSPPEIYSLNYNKDYGLCFISYASNDGREAWSCSSLYKILNSKPVLFLNSFCDDCEYDIFKNNVVIYNHYNCEVFDTSKYGYDLKYNSYKLKTDDLIMYRFDSKSILTVDKNLGIIYYDKSKNEFIVKRKEYEGDKFHYERYKIENEQFKKK